MERQIVLEFTATVENAELKFLLGNLLTGSRPYGKIEDIVSFFPKEEEQLTLLRDQFLSRRVKTWMEENNLYTLDSPLNSMLNL